MKLSVVEIVILVVAVFGVGPLLAALLTPSPDAVTMGMLWLAGVALFVPTFFVARWLIRRKR
jgi:Sec-independent protein secretion pathway component TatC